MSSSLHLFDYLVVFGYLGFSLGLGWSLRRQSNRDEFFSAGRSMGRVVVGLSVMATLFSANSFVMYPAAAYGNSLRLAMALVAFWAMGPVVAWVFIPVYAQLQCTTAYEYLEQRFHVSVRCLASALFILLRIGWMAAATFAAAVAIAGISGFDRIVITVGLGVVAIVYTMMGGLRAVMWTDVLQFFVFFGTILFAAAVLIGQSDGGAAQIVTTYFQGRENLWFDFSLDPTVRYGTIAILVGSFLEGLSAFGADQVAVQRYIAARNARASQSGFLITLLGLLVVIPGLLMIGMGLFSYFQQAPQDLAPVLAEHLETATADEAIALRQRIEAFAPTADRTAVDGTSGLATQVSAYYREHPAGLHADIVEMDLADQAMSQFVRLKFPPGLVGLLVAALMAATMSSIDSGVHSITTALVIDFRDRLLPAWRPQTEAGEMWTARVLIVAIGAVAIFLACFVGELGDVFDVAKKTVGAFAAPLLAVFILGLFVSRATTFGVFWGTWLGAGFTLWFSDYFDHWFSLWIFPVGFFASLGLSLALSWIPWGDRPASQKCLTFWEVRRSTNTDSRAGSEDA